MLVKCVFRFWPLSQTSWMKSLEFSFFGIEIGTYLFYATMSLAVTTQPSWFWCQEPDPLEVERRDWNQQTRRQCGTIAACSFIFFSINSSVASPVWLNCVREHLWWVTSIETVSLCFLFSTTLLVFGFKLCDLISFVVAHLSWPILLIMDLRLSVTAVSHWPNFDVCSFARGPCQWQYYLSSHKTGRTQQNTFLV